MTFEKQDPILFLIENYYENNNFSDETSSHWREFGKFQKIKKINGDYVLRGYGFGNNEISKNILLKIIYFFTNIPLKIYLFKLLKNCRRNIVNNMYYVVKKSSRFFDYDCSRNILTVNLLMQKIPDIEAKNFCIIGDGFGSLGCLLKKIFPKSKIIYINLGRTLLFDLYYSKKVFPNMDHCLIRSNNDTYSKDFNYVEAEIHKKIDIKSDIFINMHSMQEMRYEDINSYFMMMRKQKKETWFYCCNRISKKLPDGDIINFSQYPWSADDKVIIDGLCPWAQGFPRNIPPFFQKMDGPIHHRLIKFVQEK